MRSFVCLALVLAAVLAALPSDAHAGDVPLARVQQHQDHALDVAAGAGAAIAPRINLAAPMSVTFGFQGPAPRAIARLAPPRPVVAPSVFRGFGGFAAKVGDCCCGDGGCCDLQVSDAVDCVEDDVEVLEGKVDSCGRIYTEHMPTEVTHQSSYYVPRLRRYVRASCDTGCATVCEPRCDPCTTRRYVVVRRPVYRACYRPVYRSCYSSCGCGWGPFWGGFGWGLGWGVGVGLAYGCW